MITLKPQSNGMKNKVVKNEIEKQGTKKSFYNYL